jgi:hypothetical protein
LAVNLHFQPQRLGLQLNIAGLVTENYAACGVRRRVELDQWRSSVHDNPDMGLCDYGRGYVTFPVDRANGECIVSVRGSVIAEPLDVRLSFLEDRPFTHAVAGDQQLHLVGSRRAGGSLVWNEKYSLAPVNRFQSVAHRTGACDSSDERGS